nr:GGDEF domain-containing protein [uncultured Phascolarctobacterium sp.]
MEIKKKASLDEMTGAYTKNATERIIDKVLAGELKGSYSLFIIDLDDFKQANDSYGHQFGDFCIKEFVRLLRSNFRESDIVGRVGGDEFVVFIPSQNLEWVRQKAEQLCRVLDTVCQKNGSVWKMSVSIGIAVAPKDGKSFEMLYEKADKALYETKKSGKNGYTLYEEGM